MSFGAHLRRRCVAVVVVSFIVVCVVLTTTQIRSTYRLRQDDQVVDIANASSSSVPACRDAECVAFRRLLSVDWPTDKPRAAVVMLVSRRVLHSTTSNGTWPQFIERFDANFNDVFRYPLIVFHESDIEDADRQWMRSISRSTLFFQRVEFGVPRFITETDISNNCFGLNRFGLAYRHMCRFHSVTVYREPILADDRLEYVWRLDDDSELLQPIGYDLFRFMKDRHFRYGYALMHVDSLFCVIGLDDAVDIYRKHNSIRAPSIGWSLPSIVYNNFEITATSFWRSTEYREFVDYIDRLGGIYYHRWGDAPIKTMAVNLLLQPNDTHQFKDIDYCHQGVTMRQSWNVVV